MPLPIIDIAAANVQELIYQALYSHRGFILKNIGLLFSRQVNELFQCFDDFRDEDEATKKSFAGITNGFSGYYAFDRFHFGGKTTERYFINRDSNRQLTHTLPTAKQANINMDAASESLLPTIENITLLVSKAIESGLDLEEGTVQKIFNNSSLIAINHYLPTTQEILQKMLASNALTKTKEGKIKSFEKHKDLSLFSMLIYRENKVNGLEVSYRDRQAQKQREYVTLSEDDDKEIRVIVLLGKMMQHLSNNHLKALSHAVITEPLKSGQSFQRDCISIFSSLGGDDIKLKPFVKNMNAAAKEEISLLAFYQYNNNEYLKKIAACAVKEACPEIDLYPKEDEIITAKTDTGAPVYRRR